MSKNYTGECWALKCDIRKFFDSVDHKILLKIIKTKIKDPDLLWLLEKVVDGFQIAPGSGIPIGNLTSQLFANVYLNELDQFVKHRLGIKYYLRYADDFIILHSDFKFLVQTVDKLNKFLRDELKLEIHKDKTSVRKLSWGIDFVGYVALPHHQILRTKLKRRIFRKVKERVRSYKSGWISWSLLGQSIQSYFGVLKHANTYKVEKDLKNEIALELQYSNTPGVSI